MFFLLIGLVFWISSLHDRPDYRKRSRRVREGAEAELEGAGFAVAKPSDHAS
jgi:hypothetical protein